MKIPVVIVDDQEADRYLVRRHLGRINDFDTLIEISSGDRFIEEYYGDDSSKNAGLHPILVLMDINMPGRNGFETAVEVQQRIGSQEGPQSLIILMFTSSDNDRDIKRAEEIDIVKGYVSKPLDAAKINYIRDLYLSLI